MKAVNAALQTEQGIDAALHIFQALIRLARSLDHLNVRFFIDELCSFYQSVEKPIHLRSVYRISLALRRFKA